jgi:membrane associated rhomboid family serine protease
VIPLRDENPTRTIPFVVYGLIALNIIAFVYNGTMSLHSQNPLAGYTLVPAEIVTGKDIGPMTPIAPWVTIFTSMFLHANLLHIGGNMLYLWIFGNNIEDVLGHFRFLIFYLLSGVGAALAQVSTDPGSQLPMVGASGAIAGVLSAYLVLFPKARVITLLILIYYIQIVALPAYTVLGFWIILQLINSLLLRSGMFPGGGVAYAAHIGGFASGLILVLLFGGQRLLRGRRAAEYQGRNGW